MAVGELSDDALITTCVRHPELRKRVSSIVLAVEGEEGELKEVDAAEERMVEETRLLGREALRSWAERRVEATEREIRQRPADDRQGEKNSAGIRSLAKSRFGSRNIGSGRSGCVHSCSGEGEPARVFAAAAARHRRLRRRSAFRAGARQAAGHSASRSAEHDTADHVRPRPGNA